MTTVQQQQVIRRECEVIPARRLSLQKGNPNAPKINTTALMSEFYEIAEECGWSDCQCTEILLQWIGCLDTTNFQAYVAAMKDETLGNQNRKDSAGTATSH